MASPKKNKGRNKGIANLRPAKKGEVRNPKGRPPKIRHIPDILKKIGEEDTTFKQKKMTKLDAVLYNVFEFALAGKPWAVQFIAERTEGKAVQPIEMNATIQQQINIEQRVKELSSKSPDEVIEELNREILFDSEG